MLMFMKCSANVEAKHLGCYSDELALLCAALGVVFDDLEVERSEGTSSLAARAIDITAWVC